MSSYNRENKSILDKSDTGDANLNTDEGNHKRRNRSLLTLILWFIIITVVAWIILWSWKPEIVQSTDSQGQPTGEPDGAKVLVGAVIIGILAIIIIYLLWYCCA